MKKLTGLERLQTALRHQEPDRVPTFELDIDRKVIDRIKSGMSFEDFVDYMDLDGLVMFENRGDSYETVNESKGLLKDKWGAIRQISAGSEYSHFFIEAPIKSEKDLKRYKPPDPDVSGSYRIIGQWKKRFGGKRAVFGHVLDSSYSVSFCMLNQVDYFKAIKTNPDLILKLNEIAGEYHLKYVKNCVQAGVDMMFVSGDLATNTGPMMSLPDLQKFVTPENKRIVQYLKSKGIPCVRHCDGNIWKIMDLLLDTGYDGINPIDTAAGMDLGEMKIKYGDKITLMGNVDCTYIMTWGTTEQVRDDVKRCIRQAARGGGYICMTSNTVHSATKPENYVAMVEAIKEFGKYPISI